MQPKHQQRRNTIILLSIFVCSRIISLVRALRRNDDFEKLWSGTFLLLFGAILVYRVVQWRRERKASL